MSKVNDGGPAFPVPCQDGSATGGMSLRDWFAGQALAGMTTDTANALDPRQWDHDAIANAAYKAADAMLAARESKP